MREEAKGKREKDCPRERDAPLETPERRAAPTFPSPLFPFPALFVVACTSLTTRPTLQPFPQATYDTLPAEPAPVIAEAADRVKALGLEVEAASEAEGYLQTRWFHVVTRRSQRRNTDPVHMVRMRIWADPVALREAQVVIETVARRSLDPSISDRQDEDVVDGGSPGDSLTQAIHTALKQRFGSREPGAENQRYR